jgi:magnesium transporter
MIHAFWCEDSQIRLNVPSTEWHSLMESGKGLLWVDMDAPTEDEIDLLSDVFRFHTLSIEDCIFPNHRPKIDDYGSYIFVIFHAMALKAALATAENLEILELNIYVGRNYLVTFHEDPIVLVNQIRTKCSMNPSLMSKGSDALLHLIMDSVVDDLTRLLDKLEDKLDVTEDKILADEEGALMEINEFKGLLSKFRKVSGPQRDVVRMLMSQDFAFISDHRVIYFKDIHDHLVSINENANLLREVIASTMESYLSMVQKKMNDIMKVLTVATVILMPLNLVAGIYGMNFKHMPELQWPYGYYFTLLLMVAIVVSLVLYFKKVKWF